MGKSLMALWQPLTVLVAILCSIEQRTLAHLTAASDIVEVAVVLDRLSTYVALQRVASRARHLVTAVELYEGILAYAGPRG